MLWKVSDPFRDLPYDLGDLRTDNDEFSWWEIEREASRLTPLVAEQVAETPAYGILTELLPGEKVSIYLHNRIKKEIFPVLRALYVAEWHRQREADGLTHEIVWDRNYGLGPALQAIWPSDWVRLVLGDSRKFDLSWRSIVRPLYQRSLRMRRSFSNLKSTRVSPSPGPTIAVHYAEGIDLSRRSDLFWCGRGAIDPRRILIMFDRQRGAHRGHRIPESVLKEIEGPGMRWICLEPNMVERRRAPLWKGDPRDKSLWAEFQRRRTAPKGAFERWVTGTSESLLEQVDYWVSFHQAFMVKVHVDVAGARDEHMAQSIALDLTDGVRIGWQRSEQTTGEGIEIGHHPNHVYFTWSTRTLSDPAAGRDKIGPVLISGFPYDGAWESDVGPKELRATLAERGADFVVALFDNSIIRDGHYSKTMLSNLYKAFLEWVIEEPRIGVLNKPKKTDVLEQLSEVHDLMARAEATGRWMNLDDVFGRLPSDASRAADISVGIGISTAASEAVAAGGRAIHCDLPAVRSHPFYRLGFEKVVFDDLDRMMAALKRYQADPTTEPDLGDFSRFLDQIDPFMDGKAGERIGSYIGSLLSGFDAELDRERAIAQANSTYAGNWGARSLIRHSDKLSPTER